VGRDGGGGQELEDIRCVALSLLQT